MLPYTACPNAGSVARVHVIRKLSATMARISRLVIISPPPAMQPRLLAVIGGSPSLVWSGTEWNHTNWGIKVTPTARASTVTQLFPVLQEGGLSTGTRFSKSLAYVLQITFQCDRNVKCL